jgi:hypothetical protein
MKICKNERSCKSRREVKNYVKCQNQDKRRAMLCFHTLEKREATSVALGNKNENMHKKQNMNKKKYKASVDWPLKRRSRYISRYANYNYFTLLYLIIFDGFEENCVGTKKKKK